MIGLRCELGALEILKYITIQMACVNCMFLTEKDTLDVWVNGQTVTTTVSIRNYKATVHLVET